MTSSERLRRRLAKPLSNSTLILPNTNVKLTYLTDEVSRSKSELCVLSDNRRVVQISWLQLTSLQSWGWKTLQFAWMHAGASSRDLICHQRTWRNGTSGPNKVSSLSADGAVVTSNHLFEPTPKSSPKDKDPDTEALKFRYWWRTNFFFPNKLLSSPSRTRTDRSNALFFYLIVQLWGVIIEIKINHQLHIAVHVTFCYSFAPITPGAMHILWSASSAIECTVSWRDNNQSRVDLKAWRKSNRPLH